MHRRDQASRKAQAGRCRRRSARPLVRRYLGTLAVCIAGGGNFGVQLLGVVAIGAFVFVTSWLVVWRVLEMTIKVRVSRKVEQLGQDVAELGIDAYPEFVLMPEEDEDD